MTHNNHDVEDFDHDFAADDAHDAAQQRAANKPGFAGNLKAAWHGSPLFKLFVLVVIVGALAAAVIGIFSGGEKRDQTSIAVSSTPGLVDTPGAAAPPAYIDAVNDASQKRAEEAAKVGNSAVPTPVSGDVTTARAADQPAESQYDPLAEFRPNVPPEPAGGPNNNENIGDQIDQDALSKMQAQMTGLFDAWKPEGIRMVQVTDPAALAQQQAQQQPSNPSNNKKVLVPAGTINYGQMLIEANSDVPGPIVATIMSGPFSGGRAIGAFEVARDYLIIRFKHISYRKKDYECDVLAVDPNTTLGGLVTEKDNRYFSRVVLPTAAAFIQGFGQALSSQSTSVYSNGNSTFLFQDGKQGVQEGIYRGLQEGANTVGGFMRDEAQNIKPLVRVASGTPMGLFFVNSVVEGENGQQYIPSSSPSLVAPVSGEVSGPANSVVAPPLGSNAGNIPLTNLPQPGLGGAGAGLLGATQNGGGLGNGGVTIINRR